MKKLESVQAFKDYQGAIQSSIQQGKRCIAVCGGTGCRAFGGVGLIPLFEEELKRKGLDDVCIKETGCHGFCEKGPIVIIYPERIFYQQVAMDDVEEIVSQTIEAGKVVERLLYTDPLTNKKISYDYAIPFYNKQKQIVLKNRGEIDPSQIDDYIGQGGYLGLISVLDSMSPEQVVDEIKISGLRGRGGAGFSTGTKWELCQKAGGSTSGGDSISGGGSAKYVICNGDEGDPGAFINRTIMEGDPHLVIEGLIAAAYAVGAEKGYVYIRSEYPLAIKHIELAIVQANELGLLGNNILGTGFSLQLEIKEGYGAFVCGEETALIASIEGRRGMPTPKPPFPTEEGLWGKPTLVNNVETLASIPAIISNGGKWYSSIGTEKSRGTKIFALSGRLNNTGLVELPLGTPLRDLIFSIGGGMIKGKKFKAAMVGGPSGGFILPEEMEVALDYESLEKAGAMLGSGIVVVLDENSCMVESARSLLEFLKDESCGQCTPCRIGLTRMFEILSRIVEGHGEMADLNTLIELGGMIKDTALCNLGKTAPNPILSAIDKFRGEFEIHIEKKKCPAHVCDELYVAPCADTCPVNIEVHGYVALIAEERFIEALELIKEKNPFPSICGRVCHHPCESRCRRSDIDSPVALKGLKRFVADHEAEIERAMPKPMVERIRDEKIAMIGAGPASLACAYHLARRGYQVTIFEALSVAGGMLAVAIPNYRLPKDILQIEIDDICRLGVKIQTNTEIGKDISFDDLQRDYNAVFIGVGARLTSSLNIPGEDADGVIPALEYLMMLNLGNPVDVKDKRVVVIGAGNVAIDAARASLRLGASVVTIVYRRSRDEMPANLEEIEDAEHEGICFELLTAPVGIITHGDCSRGDAENAEGEPTAEIIVQDKVKGLECTKMKLSDFFDKSGRRKPVEIEGSGFVIEADVIIPAIGQRVETDFIRDRISIKRDGTIVVDPETQATNIPGVFAGGDVTTGAATVIDAINAGNKAAISIDKYLNNGKESEEVITVGRRPSLVEDAGPSKAERHIMPTLDTEKRLCGFEEVELGFTHDMAVREAQRCLKCHEKG
ncbi:FAD-dependent oxidoreductase [bacterium]|nr:FAD-dependent oxidoreductase [bacterium]